jgi:hypothetical protein
MTVAYLAPSLHLTSYTASGALNVGGTIYTYQGGTNTPIATYVDNTGTTTNTNPITLNSKGQASVWLIPNQAYKLVEYDQGGNLIATTDQVVNSQLISLNGGSDTGSASLYLLNFTSPFATLAAFTGTPIFWVAANNSTAGASINVNGLGVVGLYNGNGTVIGNNQILAGYQQEIVYQTNIAGSGNSGFVLFPGTSLTGSVIGTFGQEVTLSSAATVDLGTVPAHAVAITGTTTVTSFGSSASLLAPYYLIRFLGAMTLTYNASTLILPGGTNITTSAGDSAIAQYLGSGAWRVAFYQYSQSASSNAKIKPADTVITSSATLTADPDLQSNTLGVGRYSYELYLLFDSVSASAGFKFTSDGTAVDSRGTDPALAYGYINAAAYGPKADPFYSTTVTYATVSTAANSNQALYKGSLLVGTAGTFGISWAQSTSTASATTLRAGSYLNINLLNTGSTANVVQHLYQTPGSGTETIPTGYTTLTIECWGAGGGGNVSFGSGMTLTGGGGGGGGGYSRTVVSVSGLGGDTLAYTVGTSGAVAFNGTASSVSSGTLSITTMTCNGGLAGTAATSQTTPGSGGTGGTASGGTAANTSGNNGNAGQTQSGIPPGGGGGGGFAISGVYYGSGNGGSGGGTVGASAGSNGAVLFHYA